MSSGSNLAIYRKFTTNKVDEAIFDAIKAEYSKFNKENHHLFSSEKNEEDFPILFDASFKYNDISDIPDDGTNFYCDKDRNKYVKLLNFHFCSDFTALKRHFGLDPYHFKDEAIFISKNEAKRMLQAIEYLLNGQWSKKFEDILRNEYVEVFGENYPSFNDRFKKRSKTIYVDKNDDGWTISNGDYVADAEIEECDECTIVHLKTFKAALSAFLESDDYSFDKQELILHYSVYG